jgi:predicted RNA-binding Zn-ribbon protein involved in translation (DUF1610 family)
MGMSLWGHPGGNVPKMNDQNELSGELLHFHVCRHCESALRREVFEGRALTSGIYLCPKCGFEGPLNVEIRKPQEPEPSEEK